MAHPRRQRMAPDHTVENDFQGPGSGQAHCRLDQHGQQDDRQCASVGPDQAADKLQHRLVPRTANIATLPGDLSTRYSIALPHIIGIHALARVRLFEPIHRVSWVSYLKPEEMTSLAYRRTLTLCCAFTLCCELWLLIRTSPAQTAATPGNVFGYKDFS